MQILGLQQLLKDQEEALLAIMGQRNADILSQDIYKQVVQRLRQDAFAKQCTRTMSEPCVKPQRYPG